MFHMFLQRKFLFLSVVVIPLLLIVTDSKASSATSIAAPNTIHAEPLISSEQSSDKLFTRLEEAESGIQFKNKLSIENQRNFTFNGAGAASGDFDGDGLVDLYLVSEEGQSKLYRNLGGFTFEDVTEKAGLNQNENGFGIGAYFADIDNDRDLDLFLTNWNKSNQLYRNNGDGTFTDITQKAGLSYNGGATTATFADYDRDGDLDFFVATYRASDLAAEIGTPKLEMKNGKIVVPKNLQSAIELFETKKGLSVRQLGEADLLYRNNGDGTFTEVAKEAGIVGGFWGLSASFSDVDDDGWPDLYVTNDFWSPDMLYYNNGDGTFTSIDANKLQQTPMFAMGMDFGDINNDGLMDFFVGDMLSKDATLRLTQHGLMDTTLPPDEAAAQVMHNGLFLNNGDGSFSEIAWFAGVAASDWTWSTKFIDVDLDGYVDLLINNGMVGDLMDSDVLANINLPQFKNAPAYYDSYPKLETPNVAFRNNGDLTFTDVSAEWGIDDASIAHGATLADFDNDGDVDKVDSFMNMSPGVYRNNAQKNRIVVELVGYRSNSFGIGAKVTVTSIDDEKQTRQMSSSGGYLSSHAPALVFGLGGDSSIKQIEVEWPSGHYQKFTASNNMPLLANQRFTIAEPNEVARLPQPKTLVAKNTRFTEVGLTMGINRVHIEANFDDRQYKGYDDFKEQPLLPRRLSAIGPGVAWADMDTDGDDDLYIAGAHGQAGMVFQNNGDKFESIANRLTPSELEEVATIWQADGSFASSFSKYEVPDAPITAMLGDGQALQLTAKESGGAMALSDFDGDGDLDLFIGGRAIPNKWPQPASSYLYRNDGDSYTNVTGDIAPELLNLGLATGAMWLDIDNDNDSDLLIATEYGPVRLFLNNEGKFEDATGSSGLDKWHGLWTGITAGDFNEDGYMDFAAANWGLNTRYSASEQYPLVLYAGNIDGDGDLDIVEAEYVNGILRPMRERGMVGAGMPFVYEKFDTFRSYAEASLVEIFGERLVQEDVMRLYANTLQHSVFINNGQGGFDRQGLPGLVQAMPGYGIVSADFNNDGHEDLYLVGNFSHNDHEFRQFAGGISYLLEGNGDGSFKEVPSTGSGLFVPYDGRGVAVSDYNKDGWVDIAVGVNDGPPLLFENNGANDFCSIVLNLTGKAPNPLAIGARVEVTRSNQKKTTREVQAGSGYFSQNSVTQLFGLGHSEEARVKVVWPSGEVTKKNAVKCGFLEIAR